jgi:hypothetical protein
MDIVFDFDGVLCEYVGWRGHDNIGDPIKENIALVRELRNMGYKLKLSTTRLNPYPFGEHKEADEWVVSGKAKEIIKDWLDAYDILTCFTEITGYKPFGDIYIDDRGFYYDRHNAKNKGDLVDRLELIINQKEEEKEKRGDGTDSSHS